MFFLYHNITSITGRVMARALGIPMWGTPRIYARKPRNGPIIRWGCTERNGAETVLNQPEAIARAGNKITALQLMKEAGVSVPWFTTNRYEAQTRCADGKTVFGRTASGSAGRGITIYAGGAEVRHHSLYTEFVSNCREYRLHVVGDQVVRVQRKYPEPGVDAYAQIKNHGQGFVFKQPAKPLHKDRITMACNAVKALGLDFGAVDAVVDDAGTMFVLEVNTAPSCSPLTAKAYLNPLAALIKERTGIELHTNPAACDTLAPDYQ